MRSSGVRRPVALSPLSPPVVSDAVMLSVFSSAVVAIILSYCVVVDVASASITTVLPVAAADRVPKWPSIFSIKDAGAPALLLLAVPAVAEGVILWMRVEKCVESKALPRPVVSIDYRSIDLWRGRK